MYPIRIGACGWSYKDWAGVFYPDGAKPADYLSHYGTHFPVVEVDSTFYHSPSVKTAQGWREKTPDGFTFSLKVPQTITHEKLLADRSSEVTAFLTAARALELKLACCLLQFGYFNRKAFVSCDRFVERLDPLLAEWPRDVPVAVEIRNKTWVCDELFVCLRKHGAAFTLTDQAWM